MKTWKNQTAADATDNFGMQIMQGGKLIATCHYGAKYTVELTEAIENAHMISAAPDLLEACEIALITLQQVVRDNPQNIAATLDIKRIKAAILKANGG